MQFISAFYQRFYVDILNDHTTNADIEVDEPMSSDTSDVEVCEKQFDQSVSWCNGETFWWQILQ